MARVKRGPHRKEKRKRVLKQAKGFYGKKSNAYRIARQAVDRALRFAYRDRRQKKRQLRSLWIVRINAASRENGLSYNRLISGLRQAGLELNRKILADIAVHDPEGFAAIVEVAKEALTEEVGVKVRPSRPASKRPERKKPAEAAEKPAKPAKKEKEAPPEAKAKPKAKAKAKAEPAAPEKAKAKAEPKPKPKPKAEVKAAEKPAAKAKPAPAEAKTKSELQAMTVADLWKLAEERGIAKDDIEGTGANGNVVKADLVRTLAG